MSGKETLQVNVDSGVIVSITDDSKYRWLCVLDDSGKAFYRFKLTDENMLRLIGECSHELLKARGVWYYNKDFPPKGT